MLTPLTHYKETALAALNMVVYSIKDLESLSGVKAHTIRIWEKRYKLMEPKRTKTNIRYYTDDDLRKLLNVCFLYKKGYKISKIGEMCQDTIKDKVSHYSKLNLSFEDQLDALLLFILELDSYNFNKVLDQHIQQKGLEETMNELIYPLLDKLSVAWMTGSFLHVHESFVAQVIKSKILTATEAIQAKRTAKPSYIIYLPPSEKQELSLLYLHYMLKASSCKVINLGCDINLSDLTFALDTCKPDFLFTILNEEIFNLPMQSYIDQINEHLGSTQMLLTGYQTLNPKIQWPEKVKILQSLTQTLEFIKKQAK